MAAKILDGKVLAARIADDLRERVRCCDRAPCLAVMIVGEHAASQLYVRRKTAMANDLGMHSVVCALPASADEKMILRQITEWNANDAIDGILIQAPLPTESLQRATFATVAPHKDVDGFHPYNFGLLAQEQDGGFIPCTPKGILRLLQVNGIPLAGQRVVVIGRSLIVGRPLALLLQSRSVNATVTVCHSHSRNLSSITTSADILISAAGCPKLIGRSMVRPGAVFVDVGQNVVANANAPTRKCLCGDGIFEELFPLCSHITPVPGGVGPMTVAMLMENLLEAYYIGSKKPS
ncbi:MAG: bifunctional 5,10-methylenetetrahydrofolate dehydrogenase/5,10-methenyltetrahydrofolate cyclohydrolase [Puniceicoccales bacterium]|nr:bifunctional 5,10-methylenetetrahydrofolate dehydrogenase/5,10-methenyltetrahydrofolate cyclohydrolase [Puniceicoccales bacterium]